MMYIIYDMVIACSNGFGRFVGAGRFSVIASLISFVLDLINLTSQNLAWWGEISWYFPSLSIRVDFSVWKHRLEIIFLFVVKHFDSYEVCRFWYLILWVCSRVWWFWWFLPFWVFPSILVFFSIIFWFYTTYNRQNNNLSPSQCTWCLYLPPLCLKPLP